eukprot:314071-Prymnesium_polylepis.1
MDINESPKAEQQPLGHLPRGRAPSCVAHVPHVPHLPHLPHPHQCGGLKREYQTAQRHLISSLLIHTSAHYHWSLVRDSVAAQFTSRRELRALRGQIQLSQESIRMLQAAQTQLMRQTFDTVNAKLHEAQLKKFKNSKHGSLLQKRLRQAGDLKKLAEGLTHDGLHKASALSKQAAVQADRLAKDVAKEARRSSVVRVPCGASPHAHRQPSISSPSN